MPARKLFCFALQVSVLAWLCAPAAAGIRYSVTVLPMEVSYQNSFFAAAMNNKGEVVGKGWDDHGYIWRPGSGYAWLGQPYGNTFFNPAAINDSGQIVGRLRTPYGIEARLRQPTGTWVAPPGSSFLTDISNNGHLAGGDTIWIGTRDATRCGYWETPDSAMTYVYLGTDSQSMSVNVNGKVCGYYNNGATPQAFAWTASAGMHALPVPGDTSTSQAVSINNSGQMAGYLVRTSDNRSHGVLWTGAAQPLDLGTLGGATCALAVNNVAQVVGWSYVGSTRGFVHFNNTMFDLNAMVVAGSPQISSAIDINDAGQILASTSAGYGILTPVYMTNPNFQVPLTGNWNVSGAGSAQTVEYGGAGQYVARLTAGSPVTVSQNVATPLGPFELAFDYQFLSTDPLCELTVSLAGVEVGSLTAPPVLAGGMTAESWMITDQALRGLDAASLSFTYDGPSGSQGYLDNITITQTPEPATLALLAVGGLALIRRRKP